MKNRATRWTDGPWEVKSPRVVTAAVTVTRPDGSETVYQREIANCCPVGSQSPWPGEERRANARLIAAAPDLYEACVPSDLEDAADIVEAENAFLASELRKQAAAQRAAMARAQGSSNV